MKALEKVFYGSASVGAKGQIVIPAKLRKEIGLQVGDSVIFTRCPHKGGFGVIKPDAMDELRKILEQVSTQSWKKKK